MCDELASDRDSVEALIRNAGLNIEQLRLARDAESSSEDDGEDFHDVCIGDLSFTLTVAPDDGEIAGTLFASQIWNGAKFIAEYCHEHPGVVAGKATLELGAACALPSLVALHHEANFTVITDYPEEPILCAIRRNLQVNSANLGSAAASRCQVLGHRWGEDTSTLLQYCPEGFDVAFAAECLWLHKEHMNLLSSLDASLKVGGVALISYAHHVPGCEDADDAFFAIAEEQFGFAVVGAREKSFPKMWNDGIEQLQYLRILKKMESVASDPQDQKKDI